MSTMSSLFGQVDTEALFWRPTLQMADPSEPTLIHEKEGLPPGGATSPLSFFSSSPQPFLSQPSSPSPPAGDGKAEVDALPFHWLADELCLPDPGTDYVGKDAFAGMDWMDERIDLSQFDLESLIGSEDTPSSPEELIASLDAQTDDQLLPSPCPVPSPSPTPPSPVPEVEREIKSEPASPLPLDSPPHTLVLGSEVDVCESETQDPVPLKVPKIVLSLSPTRIYIVLPAKQETSLTCAVVTPPPTTDRSPSPCSSRATPYSDPAQLSGRVKVAGGGVKVDRKLKKMEQNKTAATRYRKKKRVEADTLHTECDQLEQQNRELVEKVDSLAKEIQYLQELMEEVKRAKSRKDQNLV